MPSERVSPSGDRCEVVAGRGNDSRVCRNPGAPLVEPAFRSSGAPSAPSFILFVSHRSHLRPNQMLPLRSIVVTATRAPTPRSSVGDSVTVIESDTARMSQKTVCLRPFHDDAWNQRARNGGLGTTTSLRIRGAEPTRRSC